MKYKISRLFVLFFLHFLPFCFFNWRALTSVETRRNELTTTNSARERRAICKSEGKRRERRAVVTARERSECRAVSRGKLIRESEGYIHVVNTVIRGRNEARNTFSAGHPVGR